MDDGGSPVVALVLGRVWSVGGVWDMCVKYPGHDQSIVDQYSRLSLKLWKYGLEDGEWKLCTSWALQYVDDVMSKTWSSSVLSVPFVLLQPSVC